MSFEDSANSIVFKNCIPKTDDCYRKLMYLRAYLYAMITDLDKISSKLTFVKKCSFMNTKTE